MTHAVRVRRAKPRMAMRRRAPFQICLTISCALLLSGCATPYVERLARADGTEPCVLAAPQRNVLVGVALSGGGSRAALFGAAGLEALAQLRVESV